MEKAPRSRRKFIKALVLAAVSLPVLGKYLIPRVRHKKPLLRVPKKDLPGNGALVFKEKKIAVVQKNGDVFALELTCTHLGCTVNPTTRGFVCPCHGSIFGPDGKVLQGPADRPLPRRTIEKDGEHIVIS